SIPLAIKSGPDGNVYLLDWYDQQICHLPQPEKWDRTNGRIYKISYRDSKPVKNIDLSKMTDMELVKCQKDENDWWARTARRILQERAAKSQNKDYKIDEKADQELRRMMHGDRSGEDPPHFQLRAYWTLHVTNGIKDKPATLMSGYLDRSPDIAGWTLRLME